MTTDRPGSRSSDSRSDDSARELDTEALTWAALLGHWLDVARASTTWADDHDGDRWRASLAPAIELQALVLALDRIGLLPIEERAIARDRAAVATSRAATALDRAWQGEPMPSELVELLDDSVVAQRRALYAGLEALIWRGTEPLVVPAIGGGEVDEVVRGTLAAMQPGTIAMPGAVLAWWTEREPPTIRIGESSPMRPGDAGSVMPGLVVEPLDDAVQVYREIDDDGRIARDLIAPLEADLPAGMPLLVPISLAGERIGAFAIDAASWEALQRAAMPGPSVPLEDRREASDGD